MRNIQCQHHRLNCLKHGFNCLNHGFIGLKDFTDFETSKTKKSVSSESSVAIGDSDNMQEKSINI
ncbi:MAG: hypothetical protein B6D37_00255 [Sphingobacteriales bacterium UTBCD1]|jgi:hypothetical protein|nr:MAG: hypothetical protein B6D37_00255 [Sphingobacteriales bacterium UTBCD1]